MSDAEPLWVLAADAADLVPGGIAEGESHGTEFVVWRAGSGDLCAMEARCPHNWSHLGSQGAVDGDEIVCLTHQWRFDTTGNGSTLDRAGQREAMGSIATLACRVDDTGGIWVALPGQQ